MAGFLLRAASVAIGLLLATKLLKGLYFDGPATLIASALLLGVVNAIVRPIAIVLTLPLTLLTLGLFLLVVNAAMLGLVAWILEGFAVHGFWSAVGASLIISVTSWIASSLIGNSGRWEVIGARK